MKTWCNQNGFSEQNYYYYLEKIREDELAQFPVPIQPEETKPAVFRKLEVQSPVPGTWATVIIRLNGASQQIIQAVLLAV